MKLTAVRVFFVRMQYFLVDNQAINDLEFPSRFPHAGTDEELSTYACEEKISPMNIKDQVAVITGAAGGIGQAVAVELTNRGIKGLALVDGVEAVDDLAAKLNKVAGRDLATGYRGDVTDAAFRHQVYQDSRQKHGPATICIPAAGITRDSLSVKIDKETGKAIIYSVEKFRQVTEINLIAPAYWALEMVAGIAEDRKEKGLKKWDPKEGIHGVAIFIGSVSSLGNRGQISYAATKAGLEGVSSTLMMEGMFYGVRSAIIHPGYTATPMVRAMPEEIVAERIIPHTQLRRLIEPEEIADGICFMITNPAMSGALWVDAGWHPAP
jgi:NAD(P)-dependent dehydrogenase (short-subunit alcohol dehydrogenase family)